MACLLVIGGGHRSDVIKNMTMEEWNERRLEKSPENENKQVKTLWHTIFICFQHQPEPFTSCHTKAVFLNIMGSQHTY